MTVTVCEPWIDEQVVLPCDYPKLAHWLNEEYPDVEDCDNPAEFVIKHHDCQTPSIVGQPRTAILVCAEHFRVMLTWRDEAFQKAWNEGSDGLICMLCSEGTTDPEVIFTWQRLG